MFSSSSALLQELRKKNTLAIKRQRKNVEGKWTDKAGYDLIEVPKVSSASQILPVCKAQNWKKFNSPFMYPFPFLSMTYMQGSTADREGKKIKIFTKRDYRDLATV